MYVYIRGPGAGGLYNLICNNATSSRKYQPLSQQWQHAKYIIIHESRYERRRADAQDAVSPGSGLVMTSILSGGLTETEVVAVWCLKLSTKK